MNWWNSTIDKLIYEKDKQDPETYMKGRFFVGSTIVFFILSILSVPYFLIYLPNENAKHPEMFLFNLIFIACIGLFLWGYKKFGGRVFLVNIIALFGFGSNSGTYDFNGGIYSSDLVWGIIISAWIFLVANKWSGYFWMIASLAMICFFYYAEVKGLKDFLADNSKVQSSYFFFNYLLAGLFLLVVISLYESAKKRFVTELKDSKAEIEIQKKQLEVKNKDVTDSINYAQKIQYAVLPNEETIIRNIPLSMIVFKPRDIVSGDFYWFHEIDKDNYIIVCADCTGHGVPGAMMTVIGSNLLNQIVVGDKILTPSKILSLLDNHINKTLKQQKEHQHNVQDGMDLALLKVNKAGKEFSFTSAKRPAIFIRNSEMTDMKGSKHSLGGMISGEKEFKEIRMNYQEDDIIYMYTDGVTDQFGGEKGKKFGTKRLKENLLKVHRMQMNEQKRKLEQTIEEWKGSLEQVDDICLMGIKF
jgi:serine phosphatase RsbU (regulator of sigma subunit)